MRNIINLNEGWQFIQQDVGLPEGFLESLNAKLIKIDKV